MSYLPLFITFIFFFTQLNANDFDILNPKPNKQMQKNKASAIVCTNPAVAEDKFDTTFRYGCFCGKGYPNIQHSSQKPYRYLDATQREQLIAQYYAIKPYDSIDEACMKHDICYINKGIEDQRCNDALYANLRNIEDVFDSKQEAKNSASLERRCQILASDIASVFRTVFATGENISKIRLGMLAVTTPLTLASKTLQKTSRTMQDNANYPLVGEKCLIPSLLK